MANEVPKDFSYYMAHPDEMPTDPNIIMQLAGAHADAAARKGEPDVVAWAGGEPDAHPLVPSKAPEAPVAETPPAATPPAAATPADAAAASADAAAAPPPAGVLTKDGKNFLPFQVLEDTRARARRLESLVAQQAEQLAALTKKPEAVKKDEVGTISPEELEAIKAELPALGAVIEKQQVALSTLLQKVEAATPPELTEERVGELMQEAIDQIPKLAHWQASNAPEDIARWNKASDIDAVLRMDPEWQEKSFKERFEHALELTLTVMPEKPATPQPPQKPTTEQLASAAAARLPTAPVVPPSLSALPGGTPPAQSERELVESLSPKQLADYLFRQAANDPEKLQQALNRL